MVIMSIRFYPFDEYDDCFYEELDLDEYADRIEVTTEWGIVKYRYLQSAQYPK